MEKGVWIDAGIVQLWKNREITGVEQEEEWRIRLGLAYDSIDWQAEPEVIKNCYQQWYEANVDLEKRVREYGSLLSSLCLQPDATTDQIAAAIQAGPGTDSEKVILILTAQTAFNNIVLNLEYLGVPRPQYTAWAEMAQLIANLPSLEVTE